MVNDVYRYAKTLRQRYQETTDPDEKKALRYVVSRLHNTMFQSWYQDCDEFKVSFQSYAGITEGEADVWRQSSGDYKGYPKISW